MIKKASINIIHLFLFFALQTAIHAQNRQITQPRLTPDPKALEYYQISQRSSGLTWTEMAQISLWASGDENPANLQRITDAVSALNNSAALPSSGREKAEFILEYMHANILRSYSLYQTRIDTIFTNGRFNCVSSAVLYMILCKSAGINTSGVITKEHAFIIAHIDGQNIDVETTNRYGFDPGNRKEFHDQFGRLTGFSYVPAQNYRDRQTINQIELISLVFINRISENERANRYAQAVPLAIDRTVLLAGGSFSDNASHSAETLFENPLNVLFDRLINYGASLLRANREEEALTWAVSASALYADSARWQEFFLAAVNNRVARFIRERKMTEAGIFLNANSALLTRENFMQIDIMLTDADISNRANVIRSEAEGNAMLDDIILARQSGRLPERRAAELITFTIQKTASTFAAGRDWRAAANYVERSIARFGSSRELEQSMRTYRDNIAADFHNRFAAEWNRQNYEEAERILNEGLAEFPDNRQLLSNREIVNRHNSR